jgi:hypothetical protein
VQRHDVRSVNSPDRSGRLLYRAGSQDREWCASTGLPDRAIAHTIVLSILGAVALDRQPGDLFRAWLSFAALSGSGSEACALPLTMTTGAL